MSDDRTQPEPGHEANPDVNRIGQVEQEVVEPIRTLEVVEDFPVLPGPADVELWVDQLEFVRCVLGQPQRGFETHRLGRRNPSQYQQRQGPAYGSKLGPQDEAPLLEP